jgi:hypothetical protein
LTLPALAGLRFGRLSLDPQLTVGDRRSRPPDLLGCWPKIEQELELSERVEAEVVEEANRRRIPRHRTRYQLPSARRACFGEDDLGQPASNASATPALAHHDRLELGLLLETKGW